jgi:hypothetical protein
VVPQLDKLAAGSGGLQGELCHGHMGMEQTGISEDGCRRMGTVGDLLDHFEVALSSGDVLGGGHAAHMFAKARSQR